MLRVDLKKTRAQFLCLVITSALFFMMYSVLLTGHVAMWSMIFFLDFVFFYYVLRLTLRHALWSGLRLLGSSALIVLSLANFAHYKIFNSFITASSGFGRVPNQSEMHLLGDYWTAVPFLLYAAALLFLAYLIYFEFFWKLPDKHLFITSKKPRTSLGVMVFLTVALCILPTYIPSSSWFSAGKYYGDLGPIGYIGVDAVNYLARLFTDHRVKDDVLTQNAREVTMPTGTIKSLLSSLSVSSQVRDSTLPVFKSLPNILVYQLESVPAWVVQLDDGPMPFLKQLMNEGITVDHFYGNDCHTIGAEFTSACSLLTSSAEVIGNRLEPLPYSCLPNVLASSYNYDTSAYHANVSSFWNRDTLLPQLGYSHLYFSPLFTPRAYDGAVADTLLARMQDTETPSFSYLIGFTSHGPHTTHYIERNMKESGVVIKPLTGPLPDVTKHMQISEEELRNYFGFLRSVDDAIRGVFDTLKAKGTINNTIVVLYGDHRYYSFGEDSARDYQRYNELPFVMWVPGMAPGRISITASHIDVAPTIAHLLGMTSRQTASFMGQSIFSPTRYNYALGKCGDEVYYFTGDTVVRGNQKVGRYSALNMSTGAAIVFDPKRVQMIKDVASLSDQIWSYDTTVVLPDKTLVKGVGPDIYVIDRGSKRRIENEEIFVALGYSSLDIHELSDGVLDTYKTGAPIRVAEPGLMRIADSSRAVGSILRSSSSSGAKKYIAHALGSAGAVTGCNCLEAFEESYAKGFRIFELDLALTADKKIVLFHDGNESNIGSTKLLSTMTEKEFMASKFKERLTLLNLTDLLQLMKEKPNMYVVLDTKEDFEAIMRQLIAVGKRDYPDVMSRIIPQLYEPGQLATIVSLYHFNDIIYTLYLHEPPHESVVSFLKTQKDITAVTTRESHYEQSFADDLSAQDIGLFVHTVNDKSLIQQYVDKGVGVYTDSLSHE